MITPNYPSQNIITKEKVKLALINFLLCQFFSTNEGIDLDIKEIKGFVKECALDNDFDKEIRKSKVSFTLDECIDELFQLMTKFATDFDLGGVFYPYIDTGEEFGCLINEHIIDELIQEMSGEFGTVITNTKFGYNDRPTLREWVGSSEVWFDIADENYVIVFRDGNLDESVINNHNDCKMRYDCLEYGHNNGSIHYCAMSTMSWLAIDLFDAECRRSLLNLAMDDPIAVKRAKIVSELLGESDYTDYVIAAHKARVRYTGQCGDAKNYLLRESVIPLKQMDKMHEISALLTSKE